MYKIVDGYLGWYWPEVEKYERRYVLCYWAGITLGFFAVVVAAVPARISLCLGDTDGTITKWLLVIITSFATLVTGTLLPRYRQILDARDNGRVKLDAMRDRILAEGLAANVDEAQMKKLERILAEIATIERESGTVTKDLGGAPDTRKPGKK